MISIFKRSILNWTWEVGNTHPHTHASSHGSLISFKKRSLVYFPFFSLINAFQMNTFYMHLNKHTHITTTTNHPKVPDYSDVWMLTCFSNDWSPLGGGCPSAAENVAPLDEGIGYPYPKTENPHQILGRAGLGETPQKRMLGKEWGWIVESEENRGACKGE